MKDIDNLKEEKKEKEEKDIEEKDIEKNQDLYLEIWEDLVDLKDLVSAMVLTTGMAFLGGLVIGPIWGQSLFGGLIGALSGFVISSLWIKPKRDIE